MCELGPVVVHIDDIDDDVDGVLHLVPIDVYSMSTKLWTQKVKSLKMQKFTVKHFNKFLIVNKAA